MTREQAMRLATMFWDATCESPHSLNLGAIVDRFLAEQQPDTGAKFDFKGTKFTGYECEMFTAAAHARGVAEERERVRNQRPARRPRRGEVGEAMIGHPTNCQCTSCWKDPRSFVSSHRPIQPDPDEVRRALEAHQYADHPWPTLAAAARAWLRERS